MTAHHLWDRRFLLQDPTGSRGRSKTTLTLAETATDGSPPRWPSSEPTYSPDHVATTLRDWPRPQNWLSPEHRQLLEAATLPQLDRSLPPYYDRPRRAWYLVRHRRRIPLSIVPIWAPALPYLTPYISSSRRLRPIRRSLASPVSVRSFTPLNLSQAQRPRPGHRHYCARPTRPLAGLFLAGLLPGVASTRVADGDRLLDDRSYQPVCQPGQPQLWSQAIAMLANEHTRELSGEPPYIRINTPSTEVDRVH